MGHLYVRNQNAKMITNSITNEYYDIIVKVN